MPSYKLIYFQARGAAEISRLLFAAAGVEYDDCRYSREEWPNHKSDMPLKALPALEVDGKKFCQGAAIARYIARQSGLYGKDNLDGLKIDEIHEAIVELIREYVQIYYEQDETKKAEKKKALIDTTLPKFIEYFEKRLGENGSGFFVGSGLTLADIAVYNWCENSERFVGDAIFTKSSKLKAHFELVKSQPKIAEWLKKRPVTEM